MIKELKGFESNQLKQLKALYLKKLIRGRKPSPNESAELLIGRDNLLKEMIIEIENILEGVVR